MNDEAYKPDSLDELAGDLRVAVEHLKRRAVPEAAMQRALDRAARCGSPIRLTDHRLKFKAVLGFAAAAALCIAIGLLFLRPSDLWADVVKAVQAKPWIHGTLRGAKPGQSREFWLSTSQGTGGSRSEEEVSFFDDRLRIVHQYNPKEKVLYRLPASPERLAEGQQLLATFQGLFHGNAELKAENFPMILKDQTRRQTEKDGRKWDVYELHFQIPPGPNGDLSMTFMVDAQTRLPHSMTMSNGGGEAVEWTFNYPENGPADIYALGVPKDAKLVDRLPTADMSRILAAIEAGRDRFDDFEAIVIKNESPDLFTTAGKPIPVAFLVWKKGNRWRVETALPPQEYFGNHFPPDKDHKQWLRDMFKKAFFTTQYVCDGKAVYQGDMGRESGKVTLEGTVGSFNARAEDAMPFTWCYPRSFNSPNDRTEETLNLKPTGGPPNTILVTSRVLHPRENEIPFQLFWLDPTRGYAVVRRDLRNTDPAKPPTDRDYQDLMDQWEQTPKGIWYPTRVNSGRTTWYHFFLNFPTDIPDELFKPAKRTVLTDRYPVGS
jgi:hypothetical protein